jgi:hypothetical protein
VIFNFKKHLPENYKKTTTKNATLVPTDLEVFPKL